MRPSCVLIDLDNTIYEYEPANRAGMHAVKKYFLIELGILEKDFDICFLQARTQIKQKLGDQAASHSRLLYFQRVLELLNLGSQPGKALLFEQIYWQNFLSAATLLPQVEEFLDDVRIAGIPIVLVTDLTASIQMRKYLYWDLGRFLDIIVTSEENGADKPSSSMFELALAKLGGVSGQVWMIGDDYDKDIVGAKNSIKAKTFLRKSKNLPIHLDDADIIFTNFSDIRDILKQLSIC